MDKEIVYFELNNWFSGMDYPDAEPFITWMSNDLKQYFRNEEWVKENKLCVVHSIVDMSMNYCITATKEWVEENCPELLTKYTQFIREPDEWGDVEGQFGSYFRPYEEQYFGVEEDENDY